MKTSRIKKAGFGFWLLTVIFAGILVLMPMGEKSVVSAEGGQLIGQVPPTLIPQSNPNDGGAQDSVDYNAQVEENGGITPNDNTTNTTDSAVDSGTSTNDTPTGTDIATDNDSTSNYSITAATSTGGNGGHIGDIDYSYNPELALALSELDSDVMSSNAVPVAYKSIDDGARGSQNVWTFKDGSQLYQERSDHFFSDSLIESSLAIGPNGTSLFATMVQTRSEPSISDPNEQTIFFKSLSSWGYNHNPIGSQSVSSTQDGRVTEIETTVYDYRIIESRLNYKSYELYTANGLNYYAVDFYHYGPNGTWGTNRTILYKDGKPTASWREAMNILQ